VLGFRDRFASWNERSCEAAVRTPALHFTLNQHRLCGRSISRVINAFAAEEWRPLPEASPYLSSRG